MSEFRTTNPESANRLLEVLESSGLDYQHRRQTKHGGKNDTYIEHHFEFSEEAFINAIISGKIPLARDVTTQ